MAYSDPDDGMVSGDTPSELFLNMHAPHCNPPSLSHAFETCVYMDNLLTGIFTERPAPPNTLTKACRPLTPSEASFDLAAVPLGLLGLAEACSLLSHLRSNAATLDFMWRRFDRKGGSVGNPPTLIA